MAERIQFVDENDNPIGAGPREEAWSKKLHHRVVQVILRNESDELLIQRRSAAKKSYPNIWTCSASGNVDEGESYETTANREMVEEIGVNTELKQTGKILVIELKGGNDVPVFHMAFEGVIPGTTKIEMQESEVSETKWISLSDLKQLMCEHPDDFTPGFLESIRKFY